MAKTYYTWKAAGCMERERSLLFWRSMYSRFRTEVRTSPGMLWMEFFSRWSSTRFRGKPFGTVVKLLFDKSRHSRLLRWLPEKQNRLSSSNQIFETMQSACIYTVKSMLSPGGLWVRTLVHLNVSLSMPSLLRRLFWRYSSLRLGKLLKAPAGISSSVLLYRDSPNVYNITYSSLKTHKMYSLSADGFSTFRCRR